MSTLTYHDFSLQLIQTMQFSVERETDPTGIDQLWTKFTLRVRGTLTLDPNTLPSNSATTLESIKYHLELPRRNLTYTVNGTTLLSVTAPDARYGPEPMPTIVRQISSGVFFVEWGCVACIGGCGTELVGGGNRSSEVVSVRWQQKESYDINWRTTLHTSGLLIVRTDLRKLSADSFRALCTPPIKNNMVRSSASYTLDESGTKLTFDFTDVEQDVMPPSRATKAGGQFVISEPMPGAMRIAVCTVRLQGPPGSSRNDLMAQAFAIAFQKIDSAHPQTGQVNGQEQAIFGVTRSEMLYENIVECQIEAKLAAFPATAKRTVNLTSIGDTPGSNPAVPSPGIAPPLRRQIATLLAAAFSDPCAQVTALAGTEEGGFCDISTREGQPREADISTATDSDLKTDAYDESDIGPYDWYKIETLYEGDEGRGQMPGTGVGPNARVASIVKVHGGSVRITVNWTARRQGKPPVIPSYPSKDSNIVERDWRIMPENPDFNGDPTKPIYTTSGSYRYYIRDPAKLNILAAIPPFMSDAASLSAKLPASRFSSRILWGLSVGDGPVGPGFSGGSGGGSTGPKPGSPGVDTSVASNADPGGGSGGSWDDGGDNLPSALGQPPPLPEGIDPSVPLPGFSGPGFNPAFAPTVGAAGANVGYGVPGFSQ